LEINYINKMKKSYICLFILITVLVVGIGISYFYCNKESYWPSTQYAYTYVNNEGQEGEKSPLSDIVQDTGDKKNPIIQITPNKDYKTKIYRTTDNGQTYTYLGELDQDKSYYTDTKPFTPPPPGNCLQSGNPFGPDNKCAKPCCKNTCFKGTSYFCSDEQCPGSVPKPLCCSDDPNSCGACHKALCGSTPPPPPSNKGLHQFRITPVTLRNDDLVEDWKNNGKVPIRLSWISKPNEYRPKNIIVNGTQVKWDHSNQFFCGWKDLWCQTVQTTINEGTNTISVEGMDQWQVYYPKRGEKLNFVSIGDPHIADDGQWSLKHSSDVMFKSLNRHMTNIHALVFGGDNFYDTDNHVNTYKFFGGVASDGTKLDTDIFTKLLVTVIGNHDYTFQGSGYNNSSGRQYIQFYGIDGWETPFGSTDPSYWCPTSPGHLPQKWTTGCYVIGDTGFITGDNSYLADSGEANYPDVAQRFKELGVKKVFYVSHWFVKTDEAVETTAQAWGRLQQYFKDFTFNYISNHTHENSDQKNGNRLTGGNGQTVGCSPGDNGCIGSDCCCPSYFIDENWEQGWSPGGACDKSDHI
jgi:hypothetical protein